MTVDLQAPRGHSNAPAHCTARENLSNLVDKATRIAPDEVALNANGKILTFAELASMVRRMPSVSSNGAGPDDSSLIVTLMLSVPGLAIGGDEAMRSILGSLRANAVLAVSGLGQPDQVVHCGRATVERGA